MLSLPYKLQCPFYWDIQCIYTALSLQVKHALYPHFKKIPIRSNKDLLKGRSRLKMISLEETKIHYQYWVVLLHYIKKLSLTFHLIVIFFMNNMDFSSIAGPSIVTGSDAELCYYSGLMRHYSFTALFKMIYLIWRISRQWKVTNVTSHAIGKWLKQFLNLIEYNSL